MLKAESAHITLSEALDQLPGGTGAWFRELYQRGTLSVEIYAPRGVDPQAPHTRDEVYIVAKGSGIFWDGEDRKPFKTGDFLFVAAGRPHRFEDFTDDFTVWVIFYGPEGGET